MQIVGSNEASIVIAQEMINLLLDQLPPGVLVVQQNDDNALAALLR